ncbi:MAG: hypothetical protein IT249_09440 [Chitinophagaceae bacterium]|nr:hypothetical protein [Chitinophagaceae bacterium]
MNIRSVFYSFNYNGIEINVSFSLNHSGFDVLVGRGFPEFEFWFNGLNPKEKDARYFAGLFFEHLSNLNKS